MSRTRRCARHGMKSEINIVPLLDVLLVLLLIFMATAPIISQSVSVDLPAANDSQTVDTSKQPPVIVEVFGIGNYSVKAGDKQMDQLPTEQVIAEAQRHLQENSATVFLIAGGKDVPYNEIIKVIDALRKAGVKSVGLMSRPV